MKHVALGALMLLVTALLPAPGGKIFVGLRGAAPRIVGLSEQGAFETVVTSGGNLLLPAGMAFGADQQLCLCDAKDPLSGPTIPGLSGPIAFVPDGVTPTTKSSWGRVKVISR